MNFTCLACKGSESTVWLEGCRDYYLVEPGTTTCVRCLSCGLVQQHPLPADTGHLYSNYPIHRPKAGLFNRLRRWVFRLAYFDASHLPAEAGLLDFGCGDGWYLEGLKASGRRLLGFEFDTAHARRLTEITGVPVRSDWSELVARLDRPLDVVTMHYVMEHLASPNEILNQIHGVLAPRGLVYVLLPNIHSWEARLFGRKWHGLDQPRHISFPDLPVLRQMAARAGFEVVEARPVPFPNTLAASLAVVLFGRFRPLAFFAFLPLGLILSACFPSGSMAYQLRPLLRKSLDRKPPIR